MVKKEEEQKTTEVEERWRSVAVQEQLENLTTEMQMTSHQPPNQSNSTIPAPKSNLAVIPEINFQSNAIPVVKIFLKFQQAETSITGIKLLNPDHKTLL